ncbi:hypothetical protein [Actinocorallia sp. A-T 12471]|uniref:hypothetical protein n=1 Tax=Actinocorallia sp. A-T 12471 TaxID=3089813 RepID=UPI0029CAE695|nr:hypothetical protein [Actinocorallia sp. A-T 12471]MDX6742632.1 hypothetical protein [Actinocorallia sp. A-T 12471]
MQPLLEVLLPLIVGAVLTLVAKEFPRAQDRNRDRARQLLSSAHAFRHACERWLDVRLTAQSTPSTAELRTRQEDLAWQLEHVISRHPCWRWPRRLLEHLQEGPFGPGLTSGWTRLRPEERRARHAETHRALDEFVRHTARLAARMEHPLLSRREMRSEPVWTRHPRA